MQTHGRTPTRSLARTLTRTYIRSHVRSLARMSFTHTFIPPFMSLVTTRTLANKNILRDFKKAKLSHKTALLRCPSAFRLRRLAQNGCHSPPKVYYFWHRSPMVFYATFLCIYATFLRFCHNVLFLVIFFKS